jgi:uncharacterized protein YecE (DUF72 family)
METERQAGQNHAGQVRVGVGGWVYAPWRGVFYPKGLAHKAELDFASRQLTAIEINATYRSVFDPDTFQAWAGQTPEGFVFSVKAHMACTNKRRLADVGPAIDRFLGQGLEALGAKLGPILWSLMPTKAFDPEDMAALLALLPDRLGAFRLRHVIEPRHASFVDDRFIALCEDRGVAICLSESAKWPLIEARTADFIYARLMKGSDDLPNGYADADLEAWARRLTRIADGRDAFAFFINEGKRRAPAAALALIGKLAP